VDLGNLINNTHAAFRNKPMLFQQTSVSQNIDSEKAFGKISTISKYFHRSSLKINFKYLRNYEVEKCKSHKRSCRKY
jgi:hypothetical protein